MIFNLLGSMGTSSLGQMTSGIMGLGNSAMFQGLGIQNQANTGQNLAKAGEEAQLHHQLGQDIMDMRGKAARNKQMTDLAIDLVAAAKQTTDSMNQKLSI